MATLTDPAVQHLDEAEATIAAIANDDLDGLGLSEAQQLALVRRLLDVKQSILDARNHLAEQRRRA